MSTPRRMPGCANSRSAMSRQPRSSARFADDNARLYRDAQDAVRVREEFLATTSHELRTPVSEIKGFVTTLLRTDVEWDEPTRQDFLREIDSDADRLDALISDLLDMSQLV